MNINEFNKHFKAKANLSVNSPEPLFWEVIPAPKFPTKGIKANDADLDTGIDTDISKQEGVAAQASTPAVKKVTKPSKVQMNPNNVHLKDCFTWTKRDEFFSLAFAYRLENILTGVANLDLRGNTRPVRVSMLFNLLRDLDVISTASIEEHTGRSNRYSRDLAGMLRVAVTELDKLVQALGMTTVPTPAVCHSIHRITGRTVTAADLDAQLIHEQEFYSNTMAHNISVIKARYVEGCSINGADALARELGIHPDAVRTVAREDYRCVPCPVIYPPLPVEMRLAA